MYKQGDRIHWEDPDGGISTGDYIVFCHKGDIVTAVKIGDHHAVEIPQGEVTLIEEFDEEKISEYADGVFADIADYAERTGSCDSNDFSDGAFYFNDEKTKRTYIVSIRQAPFYEGE